MSKKNPNRWCAMVYYDEVFEPFSLNSHLVYLGYKQYPWPNNKLLAITLRQFLRKELEISNYCKIYRICTADKRKKAISPKRMFNKFKRFKDEFVISQEGKYVVVTRKTKTFKILEKLDNE